MSAHLAPQGAELIQEPQKVKRKETQA